MTGVSSILFYDPGSRVVARLHPNHAFEKVVFDPWRQASWDVNDTVLIGNPAKDADAGDFFRRLPDAEYRPTWYEQRRDGALGALEREAAEKTVVHAGTPSYAYFDAMGRAFLAIAHNRFRGEGEVVDERYSTRFEIDVEGNQRSVTDAKGRVVMRTDFDLLGVALHHANMDSGERWTLGDVTALDIFTWDSRENIVRTTYDALRRPREIFLTAGADSEKLVSRTIYGEAVPEPEARNLRGRVYKTFDTAGLAVAEAYDFRGNTVRSRRQLLRQYDTQPDWNQSPALEEESFEQRTSYDAVGRPIQLVAPHGDRSADAIDVIQPSYNEANLLERVDVWLARDSPPDALLDPMSADLRAIEGIDYNARGQRMRVRNGNRTQTHFEFDPMVFRLARIHTTREGGDGTDVQDLRYVYDPAGNVVSITDKSKPTVWFRNQQVEPDARYTYDAVYRLIEATGREHIGQIAPGYEPRGPEDVPPSPQLNAADAHAFARYRERYVYDQVSNILELAHRRLDAAHQGFTRTYEYAEPSPLDPSQRSNRLSATRIGSVVDRYTYDASGNMTSMPHLTLMRSDYRDQLSASARQSVHHGTPETTHYLYDSHGGRVRKVTVRAADEGTAGTRRTERIYLDGFEVYREYAADGETVRLARSSLYVFDGDRRAVLVETRTIGEDSGPVQVVRFPYTNHLNSAVLELDREGRVISYEEYLPFGVSSYRLADSQAEAPKRFRYNGKERDEESQLYYYGARYYAAWLGRWTGCDPHFRADQSSAYVYVRANPVTFSDRAGNEESSNWNRFMGGLKVLGGAIQTVAGAAVFVQVEVPVAAQVVGGVAVVHGIDDMTTGIDQIISGKTENTVTQQVVAGTAKLAFKEKTAEAIGTGFDIAAGFVSPVPVSGVTGGGTKVVVNMPRVVAVERAGAGMKELIVTTEAVEITVNTAKATQITAGALQATGTLGSGGGGGGGPQKQEQKSEEKPKEQKPPAKTEPPKQAPPREYKVAKTHPSTGGNKQVVVDGQRWNVPKGVDPSKIPAVDKVGDQLQAAAKAAASEWNASKLSAAERQAIATAHADGEHWLARLLEQQAKGRYVEARVRPQFPNLQWNRTGVDAIDSATGIKYDVLSGTESNMTLHAKRMAKELFRMIMF